MASSLGFRFTPEYLNQITTDDFATAEPFPHVVIDQLLPEPIADRVAEAFPGPDSFEWNAINRADGNAARKLTHDLDWTMPPVIRDLLVEFNSAAFINWVEGLTGIAGIIPDAHFVGGGMHQIERGGYLKVHADFNRHDRLGLDRRLNLLFYLNRDWREEWGGQLELWNEDMTAPVERVSPVMNRAVIFATTDTSYHGHPDPLACPPGVTRRSLALYYYTNGRPASEQSEFHSTLYQTRPGEQVKARSTRGSFVRELVPPAAWKAARRLRPRSRR